jgi:hypothetical protein
MADLFLVLELVPEGNNDIDSQTIYNSIRKPKISIRTYARRLYKYMIHNRDTLTFVMYYIAMYSHNTNTQVNQFNIHRLFLTATTVAHKFWEDDCCENNKIAEIAGIYVKELNSLERDFLKGIDWRLYKLQTRINDEEISQIAKQITGLDGSVIITEGKKNEDANTEKKKAVIAAMTKRIIGEIIDTVVGNITESESKRMPSTTITLQTPMYNRIPKPPKQSKCKIGNIQKKNLFLHLVRIHTRTPRGQRYRKIQ